MKNTLKTVDCETDCLALSPFPHHHSHHSPYSRVQSHHSTRLTIHNPPNQPHLKPISNKSIKNKITNLKAYLQYHTNGESYTFTEVKVSYNNSEETIITDIEALEKYCKRHKELGTYEFKPSKTAIKEAIASGLKVKGAEIIQKKNIQIK
jgi:hypothetical protein